jgi:hypothetical protein
MNPKTNPNDYLLIKLGTFVLLIMLVLQFDSCSKSEDLKITVTGTSFCCNPYGQYIGMEINTYSSADIYTGYQSSSDSSDYEYTISPKGTDTISVIAYNVSTQTSSTYDLSMISNRPDTIIFGWDNSFAPNYISKHILLFQHRNDTISLIRTRELYQSDPQGSDFSSSKTTFKAIKQ